MADMFQTPPAGTPIEPNNGVRYYYRRQIFPATPASKDNFQPGREVSWRFNAAGQHAFVPQESRLVAKVKIERSNDNFVANFQAVEKSFRYAADPLTRLFDQARLSINGTTVSNVPTSVQDISTIQLRLEGTAAGGAACGSAGLLDVADQRMHHPDVDATGQGQNVYTYDMANARQAAAVGLMAGDLAHSETEKRNQKHQILLDRDAGAAGVGFHEISTPLGQQFCFFRQNKAFLRNMEFDIRLVVSSTGELDALYSPITGIPAQPRNQGLTVNDMAMGCDGAVGMAAGNSVDVFAAAHAGYAANDRTLCQLLPRVAPAATNINVAGNRYRIWVDDIYIDAMFAVSRSPLPPPISTQIPFQEITKYERALTAGTDTFTEQFSGIPPSVTAMVVCIRDDRHTFDENKELYSAGGGPEGFKTFQLQLGSLSLPQPSYDLDMEERKAARAYADYCSFIGGDHKDGAGAMSYSEWAQAPLLCFRILQNPHEYSNTVTLRFSTKANMVANRSIVLFCMHSKVFEAEWQEGEANPSKVLVDEVLS